MPFTDERMAEHAATFPDKPQPKFGAAHLEADIAELKNRVTAELKNRVTAIEAFLAESPAEPAS